MISVIIPIYNAEQHVGRMIECLMNQTEKDFEVLLIDDGSSDGTKNVCLQLTKSDTRFKYFYQENEGVSFSRNRGISIARGEYITFLDADDAIDKNYLAVLLESIKKNNVDIAICDVAILEKNIEVKRFTCCDSIWNQVEALNHLFERKIINSGPCAKLFRADILDGITFPNLKAYEDILFVKDVFCKCKRVGVTDRTTYFYIQNENGAMGGFKKAPTLDIVIATDLLLQFINKYKILNSECFYITASHLMQYVQPLLMRIGSENILFIEKSKRLYKKYIWNIVLCKAFPWKEKIAYLLFSFGWDIWHKKRI